MRYYSQAGQDEWEDTFFKSKKNGYFLDIGAYDGVHLSNTYYLENELGWEGLCIDADTDVYKDLDKNRNCKKINIAISNKSGISNFSQAGVSGRISEEGNMEVNTTSIDKILIEFNCPKIIDYISLDVEGHEYNVLEMFPFSEYKFILMTVEHNLYLGSDVNKKKINEILTKNGYSIYRENVEHMGYQFEDWYINNNYLEILK